MNEIKLSRQPRIAQEEPLTCGMCLHFKTSAHRSKEDLCANAGVRSFRPAPSCFTVDFPKLIKSTDSFVQLVALLGDLTPQQRKLMRAFLRTPQVKGYSMGEEVFLNLRNREYVNNYVRAFVVGKTSANEVVLAGDPSNKHKGKVFFAYLPGDKSLLTSKQWRSKLKALVGAGKIDDPTIKGIPSITQEIKEDTYEVPTIDKAPVPPDTKKVKVKPHNHRDLTEVLAF